MTHHFAPDPPHREDTFAHHEAARLKAAKPLLDAQKLARAWNAHLETHERPNAPQPPRQRPCYCAYHLNPPCPRHGKPRAGL